MDGITVDGNVQIDTGLASQGVTNTTADQKSRHGFARQNSHGP
jgi:hypothetical protein